MACDYDSDSYLRTPCINHDGGHIINIYNMRLGIYYEIRFLLAFFLTYMYYEEFVHPKILRRRNCRVICLVIIV